MRQCAMRSPADSAFLVEVAEACRAFQEYSEAELRVYLGRDLLAHEALFRECWRQTEQWTQCSARENGEVALDALQGVWVDAAAPNFKYSVRGDHCTRTVSGKTGQVVSEFSMECDEDGTIQRGVQASMTFSWHSQCSCFGDHVIWLRADGRAFAWAREQSDHELARACAKRIAGLNRKRVRK